MSDEALFEKRSLCIARAALSLFTTVGHWNAWFDGMILMSDPRNYPMQSYLRIVVVNLDMRQLGGIDPRMLVFFSDRPLRAAQSSLQPCQFS
jgi:putative aldouronate transport system permease protein